MRLLAGLLAFCSAAAQTADIVREWQNDPRLKGTVIAACVADAESGVIRYSYNDALSVIPASTLKIFTTGAAAGILGPSYRYTTTLCHTGTFDSVAGVISGDLLILGGGDPSLQSEHFETDVIARWAGQLAASGIKEIKGDVIGWPGTWKPVIPDHWIWADISNYFGSLPSGLSYRDNKFSIEFSSGPGGSVAEVTRIHPQYRNRPVTLTTSVTCMGTRDQAYVYGDPSSFERHVSGTIPSGRGKFAIEAALPDPALLCAEELLSSLKQAGIRCHGTARSAYHQRTESARVMTRHLSPPLVAIVKVTNQRSNNHYCETLLLSCGNGDRDSAISAVRQFWQRRGLDSELLYMADGSGLSRASTCTARLQCEALLSIYNDSTLFPLISNSLPLAGRDGSMRQIGKGTFLENNMRAKTGYMERVRAYCGYLTTRKGKTLAFSLIFNNYNCSPAAARREMERFLVSLADL